ncbi:MAG: peptidyl-prolyl cis-trans isomerase [Thermoanaerobaculaceae bacterium]|nr:peptidyl-prolyl cis-trans isomerase [Thermoanaerobaculaceae bacterium]
MFRAAFHLTLALCLLGSAARATAGTRVRLETTQGVIELELADERAPKTVANFLAYVKAGHFDGTIFHRVIPGFVVQGGGFTAAFQPKPTRPPIPNEAANGLKNERGTVAMARTQDPDSATSQFYINLKNNSFLDHRDTSVAGMGYCVFGRVVAGMEVVDAIAAVPTGPGGPFPGDVPREPVIITKAVVVPLAPAPRPER